MNMPDADPHERFLKLFLDSEREIFRYVAVFVPCVADAQDIVQQTAVALWRKFDEYDPARPFAPWACRFALNEARHFMRQNARWHAFLNDELAAELHRRREELEFDARFVHLSRCLQKLPPEQRTLLEAYYYRGEAVEEIAGARGRSSEAVYKVLQRVRQALKQCIARAVAAEGTA